MRLHRDRAAAVLALMLCGGPAAFGQTQGAPSPAGQPQAAPSQAPASEATVQAVTGTPKPLPGAAEVGTQQAAPSERPAPQATTSAVEKEKTEAK